MKIKPKKRTKKLSDRDVAIIECLASGYSSEDILNELNLKMSTLNMALTRLYGKTETIGRAHLVGWAYQQGILKV